MDNPEKAQRTEKYLASGHIQHVDLMLPSILRLKKVPQIPREVNQIKRGNFLRFLIKENHLNSKNAGES